MVSSTSYFLKEALSISGGNTKSGADVSSSDGTVCSKMRTRPLGGLRPLTDSRPLPEGVREGVRVPLNQKELFRPEDKVGGMC